MLARYSFVLFIMICNRSLSLYELASERIRFQRVPIVTFDDVIVRLASFQGLLFTLTFLGAPSDARCGLIPER